MWFSLAAAALTLSSTVASYTFVAIKIGNLKMEKTILFVGRNVGEQICGPKTALARRIWSMCEKATWQNFLLLPTLYLLEPVISSLFTPEIQLPTHHSLS